MQRRGGTGRPGKRQRTNRPKARKASSILASIANLQEQLDGRTHERDEALEQWTATTEVLTVISRSTFDLQNVLATLVRSAGRLCRAENVQIFLRDGEVYRLAADNGFSPEYQQYAREHPITPGRNTLVARTVLEGKTVHIADALADPEYAYGGQKIAGYRTLLGIPLVRDRNCIGAIALTRSKVRPFTDKQVELVHNFAAQAVIAIENTRLLSELRQRTSDLSESLEQQTATSDVLGVISRSPGQLQAVFDIILKNANRLCDAKFSALFIYENGLISVPSHVDLPLPLAEHFHKRNNQPPLPGTAVETLIRTKRLIHIRDQRESPEGLSSPAATLAGARTYLAVPLLKDGNVIGAIAIFRQEVRPFADKQIELVQNFASQAVIAVENARLLSELRESLEQQTASADVLRIISSSPDELKLVFGTILDKALHLCEAAFGVATTYDGERFERVAERGVPDALAAYFRGGMDQPRPGDAHWRLVAGEDLVHNLDQKNEDAYRLGNPLRRAVVDLGGARSTLVVALRKDKELLGALTVYRKEVRPFTGQQISLLQNFAAQAVIAIENARLLNELRESLQERTATAEVLKVIAGAQGELQPVFETMLAKATELCGASYGALWLRVDDGFRYAALHGDLPKIWTDHLRNGMVIRVRPDVPLARLAQTQRPVQIPDMRTDSSYLNGDPLPVAGVDIGGVRTLALVPMIKNNSLVGAIALYRKEVRPFSDKEIELLSNFASQAVIAIENARLLDDLNKLNQQLEQRVADQVGEIERMSRLRRFLPPQVADLIVASGTEKQLESHRREITALFCDLRGFTGFSESSDPEDVMALLRDYHAAIGKIIIKYSGTLERYAGDGVMVVFNDPVPVENPALQAVLMALEMRSAIGALTETWHRLGHDIGFGIGIAHGFATLGTIGFEGRFDYAAIGTVSNVASRLCDEAKTGQILINPRVLTKVENAVTVEPVGEFALKGIRRPMMAYNVLEPSSSKPN